MAGGWHKFNAPIGGKSHRFGMRCEDGVPAHLVAVEWGALPIRLHRQLEAINFLLRQGGNFWDVIRLQRQGDIGAVIEAAEARRVEIYGAENSGGENAA